MVAEGDSIAKLGSRVVAVGDETAIIVDSLLIKRVGDDISLDELLDEGLGKWCTSYVRCVSN